MPKLNQEFPVTLSFRVSVAQSDYVEDVASLHGVSVADYLRALLDVALTAEAKSAIGLTGVDDATAVARAREIVKESSHA